MKSDSTSHRSTFSIYDSIEQLQVTTQVFLSKCDKKVAKPLSRLFQQWERTLSHLITERQAKELETADLKEKFCQSKSTELKLRIKLTQKKSREKEMIKEIQAIKDHLEEGKEMWAKQIGKIEEAMQEQERSKQKIEALYRQRLCEIDAELDDIMHIHKKKLGVEQNLGEILPALFSQEELQEERKIALGEISQREPKEFDLKKLENVSQMDINSENSLPSMSLSDLKGTQKQVFERLLLLRKKVYHFKHDDTTCSESSSASLPLSLESISQNHSIKAAMSRTTALALRPNKSGFVSYYAGIVFGLAGSVKYRAGLTDLLQSDKLSVSEREKIVYKLINGEVTEGKQRTVRVEDMLKQENWGDMSSIHGEPAEFSRDLQSVLSKGTISLSKASIEPVGRDAKMASEIFSDLEQIFTHGSVDETPAAPAKKEGENKEESSMSIIKDFSRNVSMSSRQKMSEDSRRASVADSEEVSTSHRKFSLEQREPSSSFIVMGSGNLFFMPESRPRSNPRVVLRPEDGQRSRDSSADEAGPFVFKLVGKNSAENSRKPISMLNKLPILPKPPQEEKKTNIKSFRGRSLLPIQNPSGKVVHSPPGRKIGGDIKSASPGAGLKFRMRRFKEIQNPARVNKTVGKAVLIKRK
jgi:hypothetical protein